MSKAQLEAKQKALDHAIGVVARVSEELGYLKEENKSLTAQNTTLSAKVAELEGDAAVGRLVSSIVNTGPKSLVLSARQHGGVAYRKTSCHQWRSADNLLEALQALQGEASE